MSILILEERSNALQEEKERLGMHWQRLDRDNTIQVLNAVKSADNEGMFSLGTSEVQSARLPFYKDYTTYKITSFASLPSFTFQFLSDGTFFHYLDGTEDPIHTVNDKGVLNLTEHNILEYLSFYFAQVGNDEGDEVIVVTTPNDIPSLDSLNPEAYDSAVNNYKAPEVTHNSESEIYNIKTDLYVDSRSVRSKIEVNAKGRVTIIEQKTDIPQVMKAPKAQTLI